MSFAEDAAQFIGSDASVADKIRALAGLGYSRAEIARMLGKRYQHVRNVLEADRAKAEALGKDGQRSTELVEALPDGALRVDNLYTLRIDAQGWVRLPAQILSALGIHPGGVLVTELHEEGLEVLSSKEALRRMRAGIPQWRPGEPLWSEELIAERRREAAAKERK
jgi:hypothetical protein